MEPPRECEGQVSMYDVGAWSAKGDAPWDHG